MIQEYMHAALDRAHYELIEDEQQPYYGEIPGIQGVWANGKTLEECRARLADALEDWLLFSIANHYPIPSLGNVAIHIPERAAA